MKGLVEFIQEQLEHVICQDAAGNWRIKGHPGKGSNTDKLGYWKAKYKSKKDVIVAPIAEYHYLVADSYDDYIKITAINIKGKILDQFIIE